MIPKFAPNNSNLSKFLFTGRSNDLAHLFDLILSGNCIALYGERRSGKTLTLEMMEAIINGKIDENGNIEISRRQYQLIDKSLIKILPGWQTKLSLYQAIYISLQGMRTEEDLCKEFKNKLEYINRSLLNSIELGNQLKHLLEKLQNHFLKVSKKLVILMDEMETLKDYDKGTILAEEMGKNSYTEIIFLYTGSYEWRETVVAPGSVFTHLQTHYLRELNIEDTKNFLLKNIENEDKKTFIIKMSGGKPLYTQYIGKTVYEAQETIAKKDLFSNVSLYQQIKQNIFKERRLDENSQKILAALSYHQNVTDIWLAEKLKLSLEEVSIKLHTLVEFGTVTKVETENFVLGKKIKYCILGEFIESCGREINVDPTLSKFKQVPKPVIHQIRWIMMPVFLGISLLIYKYSNPSNLVKTSSFNSPFIITVELPESLEANERGQMLVFVKNTSNSTIKSLKILFDSEDIRYDSKGTNSLLFSEIEPGVASKASLDFYVLPMDKKLLESKITCTSDPKKVFSFVVKGRTLPLRYYSLSISFILGALGLFFPGKGGWLSLFSLLQQFVSNQNPKTDGKK